MAGLLAHMNYAVGDDARRVAALGLHIAYCPRAHHFFGHTPHPYRACRAAGVNVVLATDSAASNWSLSVLEEAQFVATRLADPPPAGAILAMITLNAARALGLGATIGSIAVGKLADLAAFPCSASVEDPVEDLIRRAPRPIGVWVAGERVVMGHDAR